MAAINPRDKQRARAQDEALQTRLSARFERRLRSEIGRTMREAATAYEKRGEMAIPLALSDHTAGIRSTLEADYRLVANQFGKRLLQEAKGYRFDLVTKSDELVKELERSVGLFILQWVATKVVQINRTTETQIRSIIRSGLDEGLGTDGIAKRIRELSSPFSALRAHVIARTETHTAANFGAQEAAELTGLQMQREWVSAMDDRTRDTAGADHVDADGQVVGMREPFIVSGEELMFPGDPSGSAGNVIMCRCSVAYVFD